MEKILWHRRESRRKTEKTNIFLQPREAPAYSNIKEPIAFLGNLYNYKRLWVIFEKMYLLHILKFIFSLISFTVLVGFSLAIYSGLAIELIYPEIFNDYWTIW
jgi:hypothetical protein